MILGSLNFYHALMKKMYYIIVRLKHTEICQCFSTEMRIMFVNSNCLGKTKCKPINNFTEIPCVLFVSSDRNSNTASGKICVINNR